MFLHLKLHQTDIKYADSDQPVYKHSNIWAYALHSYIL